MKILVVMKRFSTNKDMVMQNFGRQIRLFEQLADSGHKIDFLCTDMKKFESKRLKKKDISYYIEPFGLFNISKFSVFLKKMAHLIENGKYDWIVASTSPIIGILAYYYSKKYKIPMLYDLQDSFASYDEYKIPFISIMDKHVIKRADVVICVSESLNKKIFSFRKKPIYVVQNGFETGLFKPIDKQTARKKLKLPLNSKIIVYIGHLEKIKGFDTMIDAFNKVRAKHPNTYLLLSGQIDEDVNINQKNIIYREFPKRQEVVLGINSADVAIIPNTVNEFTKYCFPYKLIEYMACNVPIVATDIGDVSILLKRYEGSLCKPNDSEDLAEKIIYKLEDYKRVDYSNDLKQFKWKVLAEKLNKIICPK